MNGREKVELFIVISAWVCYAVMVFSDKADSEGFIVLTTYIVKKFLDLNEVKNGGKNETNDDNGGIVDADKPVDGGHNQPARNP